MCRQSTAEKVRQHVMVSSYYNTERESQRRRCRTRNTECADAGKSAFLASAASTLPLQQSVLSHSISALVDLSVDATEVLWTGLANLPTPAVEVQHIQKAWDKQVATNHQDPIFFSGCFPTKSQR